MSEGSARFWLAENNPPRRTKYDLGVSCAADWSSNWSRSSTREVFKSISGAKYYLGKWAAIVPKVSAITSTTKYFAGSLESLLTIHIHIRAPSSRKTLYERNHTTWDSDQARAIQLAPLIYGLMTLIQSLEQRAGWSILQVSSYPTGKNPVQSTVSHTILLSRQGVSQFRKSLSSIGGSDRFDNFDSVCRIWGRRISHARSQGESTFDIIVIWYLRW